MKGQILSLCKSKIGLVKWKGEIAYVDIISPFVVWTVNFRIY